MRKIGVIEDEMIIAESICLALRKLNFEVVGPALKDVIEAKDEAWMIKWIKNSQSLVKAGDPDALKIFNEYNQSIMSSFPQLSDDDAKSIIAYVKAERDKPKTAAVDATGAAAGTDASSVNNYTIVGGYSMDAVSIDKIYTNKGIIPIENAFIADYDSKTNTIFNLTFDYTNCLGVCLFV